MPKSRHEVDRLVVGRGMERGPPREQHGEEGHDGQDEEDLGICTFAQYSTHIDMLGFAGAAPARPAPARPEGRQRSPEPTTSPPAIEPSAVQTLASTDCLTNRTEPSPV